LNLLRRKLGESGLLLGELSPLLGELSPLFGELSPLFGELSPLFGELRVPLGHGSLQGIDTCLASLGNLRFRVLDHTNLRSRSDPSVDPLFRRKNMGA
jgi:hypothetical protein